MSEGLSPAKIAKAAGRLLAACGIAVLCACSQQPRPAAAVQPASSGAPTAAQSTAAQPAANPGKAEKPPAAPDLSGALEPPDGKWLVDDQGRQYFLTEIPKAEGWYRWLNDEKTKVQVQYGMVFDVASYDEDSFQVKIYKVDNEAAPPAPTGPSEQDLEKIAASYKVATGTVDRVVLQPFGQGLPDRGQWRNGFKVADMNGDGNPDIVHGPARKSLGGPVIFLGDGKGSWKRWSGLRFPQLAYDYGDVAVADFNGDGKLDLAFAVHLHGLLVVVSDGAGGFKEWGKGLDFAVPGASEEIGGFSSRTLEAADWNGDGRPDLVTLGEGPRMQGNLGPGGGRMASGVAYGAVVYLNQGDGTWVRKDEMAGSRLFGEDLAVADFTNDGRLDMILGSSVFGETDILRIGGTGAVGTKAELPGLRPSSYVSAVDVADFNRDGKQDLAVGYLSREAGVWRTGIDVYLARSGGGWDRKGVAAIDGRPWLTALDSGDLDGDGRLDLAGTTGEGEIWIFLGKGDGSFDRETTPEIPAHGKCRGYDVQLVNLDSDPADELVAEFAGEPSALFAPDQCINQGGMGAWKAAKKK
ncbi:MAG TPA: FG-GAP-like repeat-containing protein [Thermoanaerobaculia bacterium]|nr:FG-GAP-like repeat-containing protein [Thermoanaerobaculia bacterium]